MIPAPFDYHAPKTLAEAIALLQQHGDQAKVLSGGQSLLPLLKLRVGAAGHLIDIGRIPGLEYIKEEGGFLKIGGRTRESELEHSDLIKTKYPILHDTSLVIADPLVRNRATVGGNLAHADPANDHPATMLALGADFVLLGRAWAYALAAAGEAGVAHVLKLIDAEIRVAMALTGCTTIAQIDEKVLDRADGACAL